MARGWIRDRFFRVAPLDITVGAEGAVTAQTMRIVIQVVDQEGDDLDGVRRLHLSVLDDNAVPEVVGDYTLSVVTGTAVTTDAQPQLILDTDSTGLAVVDLLDVAGTSTDTVHLLASPVDLRGAPTMASATFA